MPKLTTHRFHSSAALGVIALAALHSGAANAQDSTVSPEAEATTDYNEILVTARKRVERLLDVPIAATAVGEGEIQRYNIATLTDIRLAAPQVSFEKAFSGSGASVTMRGISSSPLDSSLEQSVLLDYDGMPISRGRIFSDALFDLQGIDVLKGPQALYFGKNAPAGVVSVRSAGPGSTLSGYARAGYEFRARNYSFEGAVGGPLSDVLGARVAVYASTSDGYLKNNAQDVELTNAGDTYVVPAAPSRLGGEDKLAGRLTLNYSPSADLDVTLKVLGSSYRGEGLSSMLEVMACPEGQTQPAVFGNFDPYGDCKLNNQVSNGWLPKSTVEGWSQLNADGFKQSGPSSFNDSFLPTLKVDLTLGNLDLTSVTGYYYYNFGTASNQDATIYSLLFSTQTEKNKSFFQELRGITDFDSPVNFAFGGYYESSDRTMETGSVILYRPVDPDTGRQEAFDLIADNKGSAWSLYGQAMLELGDFELDAGVRYTKERKEIDVANIYVHPTAIGAFKTPGDAITGKRSEDSFSPEVTATYHINPDVMVYGAYKTGYLSGGFSNPGNLSPAVSLETMTYDNVKAEGFEIGSKFSVMHGALSGSLTAYSYKFKGLQLTSYDVPLNTFFTRNAAAVRTKGVELEARYRVSDALQFFGSGAYNDAFYISFPNAQCYFGQTEAEGCVTIPDSTARVQDQSGDRLSRAPKWIFTFGGIYEQDVSNDLMVRLSSDVRTSSGYFANVNNNPLSWQKGYALLNASIALGAIDESWTISVIGKNLTDRHYATLGLDKPGGVGSIETVASEPRTLFVQVGTKF